MKIKDRPTTPGTKRFWEDVTEGLKRCFPDDDPIWPPHAEDSDFICAARWHAVTKESRVPEPSFSATLDPMAQWVHDETTKARQGTGHAAPPAGHDLATTIRRLLPIGAAPLCPYYSGADDFIKDCCFLAANRLSASDLDSLGADSFISLKPTGLVEARCGTALDLSTPEKRAQILETFLSNESNPVLWLSPLGDHLQKRLDTGDPCIDDLLRALGLPHFQIRPAAGKPNEVTILTFPRDLVKGIAYVPTVAEAFLYHHFEPAEPGASYGSTISTETGAEARPEVVVPTQRLIKAVAAGKPDSRPNILLRPDGEPFRLNRPYAFPLPYFKERYRRFRVLATKEGVL